MPPVPLRVIVSDAAPVAERSKPGWSDGDLAECLRCADLLRRQGLAIEVEGGRTDEGDPWLVFVVADRDEPLVHAAVVDGLVVLCCPALSITLRGFTLREALRRLFDDERFARGMTPLRALQGRAEVHVHPLALLVALVMLSHALSTERASAAEAIAFAEPVPDRPAAGGDGKAVMPAASLLAASGWDGRGVVDGRRSLRFDADLGAVFAAGALLAQQAMSRLTENVLAPPSAESVVAVEASSPRVVTMPEELVGHGEERRHAELREKPVEEVPPTLAMVVLDVADRARECPGAAPEAWACGGVLALLPEWAMPAVPDGVVIDSVSSAWEEDGGAGTSEPAQARAERELPKASDALLLDESVARLIDELLRADARGGSVAKSHAELECEAPPEAGGVTVEPREPGLVVDFAAARDAVPFDHMVRSFVGWLTDPANRLEVIEGRQDGVVLTLRMVFPGTGVTRLLIVDDGPLTIMPHRLTHDVGLLSRDYLEGSLDLSGDVTPLVLVGVPQQDALTVMGWIAA